MFDKLKKIRAQYFNLETIKKTLYRFSLSILAAGASLILGLLSFGGMYALWPALIPAIISFVLSVAYEGEIYSQNIERAFEKIFTKNYFEHQLTKDFLKNILTEDRASMRKSFATRLFDEISLQKDKMAGKDVTLRDKAHQSSDKLHEKVIFLVDYETALRNHDTKTLDELEKSFSKQIRAEAFDKSSKDPHAKALYDWLHAKQPDGKPSLHEQYKTRYDKRRWPLFGIQIFSIVTSLFMGLGTTYLLVELFSLIPMLAAIPFVFWPMIITPMAAIAGLAYGLLTYNAVTNLMANNTLLAWYQKLGHNLKQNPYSLKNIGMALTATLLFAMALTLTICTAGTWWTIVQEVPPLFKWMKKIPTFVMGVLNPIITGLSSVVFNFENSSETLTMIEELLDENNNDLSIKPLKEALQNTAKHLWEKENVLQWLNPFRLALVTVVLPMRYVLFIGHLFSIGVTADRIPGLSKYFSAFLGSLSEGFEDVHYFFKHTHPTDFHSLKNERLGESQGHEHNQDLPSWIIEKIALPFYVLSAAWDSLFSMLNKKEHRVDPKKSFTQQSKTFAKKDECCEGSACSHNHTPGDPSVPGSFGVQRKRQHRPHKHTPQPNPTAGSNPGANSDPDANQEDPSFLKYASTL
ncbi:MAG: hypothetical protein K0U37_05290 [Gammaproteobacteria bacterium]|nr:hypothetical protein [Gammaproteobacteria bacterium]